MERLLIAGLLYLIGIAIVLTIKPSCMFADDGTWKEFGIGRNTKTHTWIPFWLFAVLWAMVSYLLTTIIFALRGGIAESAPVAEPPKRSVKPVIEEVVDVEPGDFEEIPVIKTRRSRARGVPMNLPDGYYVLNAAATEAAGGVPKYVYLGRGLPE
jgi:hypothetical protein